MKQTPSKRSYLLLAGILLAAILIAVLTSSKPKAASDRATAAELQAGRSYLEALSRKDPEYVGRAKAVQAVERKREEVGCLCKADESLKPVMETIKAQFPETTGANTGYGSTIFAIKPGDGSAREQAASCQKVLGGWANIAKEYATKRYRSNLINWGMLPFVIAEDYDFENDDYIFVPDVLTAIREKKEVIKAYVVNKGMKELSRS